MKQKILSFVVYGRKFLALRNNPNPEHGGDFWFVITGGVDGGEDHIDAVKREIIEETGLNTVEILSLNWGSIYEWREDLCEELNFISFVNSENITLNEEHIDYEWMDIDDFIERIKWDDDKRLLKKVLKMALNKEKYFNKLNLVDYRKS